MPRVVLQSSVLATQGDNQEGRKTSTESYLQYLLGVVNLDLRYTMNLKNTLNKISVLERR